ncbi:hypothetical protein [Streptomyces alanosinicus]|uniref:hypothetical protein n=1 Tax=Streptomyces alanosinicus TaxID=68171 RepID=UPI00167538B3|nr:hypothetical protein [Streptomyces alanosinicus]
MKNRFAGGCTRCSVLVMPDGGFLRKNDEGWEAWCVTCQSLDELAESEDFDPENLMLPTVPPSGSATTLDLRVLGMTRACWKCGENTLCLIGLYPNRPARGYVGLHTTDNEKTMELCQLLAEREGRAELAAGVKSRYSRTMRERQLANGCRRCDALQGNFPVHEEALGRVASGGVDGLDTLFVASCPVLEWQAVIYDFGGGVIAI